MEIKIASRGYS